jgi:hypothetical protein
MSNVITFDNFKPENVSIEVDVNNPRKFYHHSKFNWKKIVPTYKYDNGKEEGIYFQLPEVTCFGIRSFENKDDPTNTAPPSYTWSSLLQTVPTPDNGLTQEDADEINSGLINMFDGLVGVVKKKLLEVATVKKLQLPFDDKWKVGVNSLKTYTYNVDKITQERIDPSAPPSLFVKLKVDGKTGAIKSIFREIDNDDVEYDADGDRIVKLKDIPSSEILNRYQNVRCKALVIVHVESIFISSSKGVSIQLKLHEVAVTEILKSNATRLVLPKYLSKIKTKPAESVFASNENDEEEQPAIITRKITMKRC